MDAQIDALIMALEIPTRRGSNASGHSTTNSAPSGPALRLRMPVTLPVVTATKPTRQLPMLQEAIRPIDGQRQALVRLKDAFNRAESELAGECSSGIPQAASQRLVLIEDRLDATWRAVQTIGVALTLFQKQLSDEQNARQYPRNCEQALRPTDDGRAV